MRERALMASARAVDHGAEVGHNGLPVLQRQKSGEGSQRPCNSPAGDRGAVVL